MNDPPPQKNMNGFTSSSHGTLLTVKIWIQMESVVIQAVRGHHPLHHDPESESHEPCITLVESLVMYADAIPVAFEQEENADGTLTIQHLSREELRAKQEADPSLREVILQRETGQKPPPALRQELLDFRCCLENGLDWR